MLAGYQLLVQGQQWYKKNVSSLLTLNRNLLRTTIYTNLAEAISKQLAKIFKLYIFYELPSINVAIYRFLRKDKVLISETYNWMKRKRRYIVFMCYFGRYEGWLLLFLQCLDRLDTELVFQLYRIYYFRKNHHHRYYDDLLKFYHLHLVMTKKTRKRPFVESFIS